MKYRIVQKAPDYFMAQRQDIDRTQTPPVATWAAFGGSYTTFAAARALLAQMRTEQAPGTVVDEQEF